MRAEELRNSRITILERISDACRRCGRAPEDVTLVAVSKFFPASDIEALYAAGHRDFGENYVQEWQQKADALPSDIRWHFIGSLQSNKAKHLVGRVDLIHGVDRFSLATTLDRRSAAPQAVLLQVNTGNDEAKGGVEPEHVMELFEACAPLEHLRVRGLMTIPPFDATQGELRRYFSQMRKMFEELRRNDSSVDVLSMGMTSDFEWAIEEGATHVRVGTAIFGRRAT
ncbi:MAG: YggS family pyridoxal phosphate-dependent enzyme [bacterium]